MARTTLKLLLVSSAAAGCLAELKPANGVSDAVELALHRVEGGLMKVGDSDLDAVELALHRVENATLSPEQKRATASVVNKVEQAVVQLKTDKTLTQKQRLEKTKEAIQELQGLQAQWELSQVEGALMKVGDLPHLSSEQRANVKKVVADVEAIAKDVETGKLTGAEKRTRVGFAIYELQGLQQQWLNSTTHARVQALQGELAEKKVLLKKDEAEMKLVGLEKELAEKKLRLKKLTAAKDQSQDEQKQRQEDEAQQAMVAKLVATAKALVVSKDKQQPAAAATQATANKTKAAAQDKPAALSALSAVVTDLEAQNRKISAAIEHMDAEEKKRQADLAHAVHVGKGEKVLQRLTKQEHRNFLKARAMKESQRKELEEGIRSVQKGDVKTLTTLMEKMQQEQKSLQAKTKGFLY